MWGFWQGFSAWPADLEQVPGPCGAPDILPCKVGCQWYPPREPHSGTVPVTLLAPTLCLAVWGTAGLHPGFMKGFFWPWGHRKD